MNLQSLEEKYQTLDKENEKHRKWERTIVEKLQKGKLFSLKIYTLLQGTPIDWHSLYLVSTINTSTLNDSTPEKVEKLLNMLIKQGIIKNYQKNENKYVITNNDKSTFSFFKLTDVFKFDNKEEEDLLLSQQRSGHCHRDSILLSQGISIPNNVVSGFCTSSYSKKIRFPHTWIELNIGSKKWCIDYTMNLAIEKDGFYKIFNPTNIVEVDGETLKKDMEILSKTSFKKKDIRMYLFFPDESRQLMLEELNNPTEENAEL